MHTLQGINAGEVDAEEGGDLGDLDEGQVEGGAELGPSAQVIITGCWLTAKEVRAVIHI
jgi:hypothetical protein